MLETMQAFQAEIKAGPTWIYIWLNILSLVVMLSIPFAFISRQARWILLSILLIFPTMIWLYGEIGYVRLLGIVHIIFWTPLMIYLWHGRGQWRVGDTLTGKWLVLVFFVIAISLAFDYTDVIRWLLGERGHSYLPAAT